MTLIRHCERSEAIQIVELYAPWVASSLTLLAMTPIRPCERSEAIQLVAL